MSERPPPELYDGSDFGLGGGERPWLLYALSVPLALAALAALVRGGFGGFLGAGIAFVALIAGAEMTRQGLAAKKKADARKFTGAARWPLKTLGGALVAGSAGLAALLAAGHGLFAALAFTGVAAGGYHLLYGFEGLPERQPERVAGIRRERIAGALDEAYERIERIDAARENMPNQEMRDRLARIAEKARAVLAVIEEDPGDLRRARTFLNVHLEGVEEVTAKFARAHERLDDRELEDSYRRVLGQIETAFEDQREKMLRNDALDLDVAIEVLSKRLREEGVR